MLRFRFVVLKIILSDSDGVVRVLRGEVCLGIGDGF